MKLSVPTNWQDDLPDKITTPIAEVFYGKLPVDFVGGGKPSYVFGHVSKKAAEHHIARLHSKGKKFFYLINSACMGNSEYSRSGFRQITRLLDWVSVAGADGVVVATPYLMRFVRKNYPALKVNVSSFAGVNSLEAAKFWQDQGAESISLFPSIANRDFRLLEALAGKLTIPIQLIVNQLCFSHCPMFFYHANQTSHASSSSFKKGEFIMDYCRLLCRHMMLKDPLYIIKGGWIRPEDIKIYEDMGIERFKVVDRNMHTDALSFIVNTYEQRKYDGNLYDLFAVAANSLNRQNSTSVLHKIRYFFHPFKVNVFKVFKNRRVGSEIEACIDNSKLDGFLDGIRKRDCLRLDCEECGFCREFAHKAVTVKEEYRQQAQENYGDILSDMDDGSFFRY